MDNKTSEYGSKYKSNSSDFDKVSIEKPVVIPSNVSSTEYKDVPAGSMAYVGFMRRFLAQCIDAFIVFFIGYAAQVAMGFDIYKLILASKTTAEFQAVNSTVPQYVVIVGYLIPALYYILFWSLSGGSTLGRKIMGIKVVKLDGSPIGIGTAILRYFGFLISTILLFVGHLVILFDNKKQALHDKIASTCVIEYRKPQTALAVLITIAGLIGYMVLFMMIFQKGMQLAAADIAELPANRPAGSEGYGSPYVQGNGLAGQGENGGLIEEMGEDQGIYDIEADQVDGSKVTGGDIPLIDDSNNYYGNYPEPDYDLTVNSFQKMTCIEDCYFYQAEKGNTYLVMDIMLVNTGKAESWIGSLDFQVMDQNGFVYMAEYTSLPGSLESVKLPPGGKTQGKLVFEIPSNTIKVNLTISDGFGGFDQETIVLNP